MLYVNAQGERIVLNLKIELYLSKVWLREIRHQMLSLLALRVHKAIRLIILCFTVRGHCIKKEYHDMLLLLKILRLLLFEMSSNPAIAFSSLFCM